MQTAQASWQHAQAMRVSAHGINPIGVLPLVSLSNQFGQQISDRYRQAQPFQTIRLDQILRQSGIILNSLHQHQAIHLRPQLSLTVLNWQTPVIRSVNSTIRPPISTLINSPSQPMPTSKIQPPMPTSKIQPINLLGVNQTQLTFRRITQPEKLVEQVETRKERVERTITKKSVVSTIQSEMTVIQPDRPIREVPLVVVKSLPKGLSQLTSEPTLGRKTEATLDSELLMPPRAIQSKPLGQTDQPLAAIDVNRLTDQVVQAIDRRLTAHRERMGRG